MSERWARAMLTAYRLAGAAAYPLVGGYIAWRTTKGKEERTRRRERYGISKVARPPGPLVWVHAASVGESNAVIPLVRRISRPVERSQQESDHALLKVLSGQVDVQPSNCWRVEVRSADIQHEHLDPDKFSTSPPSGREPVAYIP